MDGDSERVIERRRTLTALIALAEGHSPADCWDDGRAEALLRSQSTAAEVRELGMSEQMIAHVFRESSSDSRGAAERNVGGDIDDDVNRRAKP